MVYETLSGVELLALYGDDTEFGEDELSGRRSIGRFLKKAARYTPQYWAAKGVQKAASKKSRKKMMRVAKGAAKLTPHYWAYQGAKAGVKKIRRRRKLSGDDRLIGIEDIEFLGGKKRKSAPAKKAPAKKGKFLPGFGKGIRSVGKVTSGFTTGIARAVGIPQSVIDAASRMDPTRRGTTVKGAVVAITPQERKELVPVKSSAMKLDAKNIAIVAGAGIGGIVILKAILSRKK